MNRQQNEKVVGEICEDDIYVKVKRQKKILYFSDGTMEEDSTSSEDDGKNFNVEKKYIDEVIWKYDSNMQ